jgi:hypothetical protein
MVMNPEIYVAHWQKQLASAKRQLSYFEKGMRWKTQGVDRTDAHVAMLKRTISQIEKLLAKFSAAAELGSRGGKARAERMSPERRAEIARKAAATRWAR